jgi:hypothetical protein
MFADQTPTTYSDGTKTFYVPLGYEMGESANNDDDFLILSDHNRQSLDFSNTRIENRQRISNNLFLLSKNELNDNDIDFIKRTILENMKILLECEIEEFKFLINYILVGGLGLVIPQVKKDYPDFSFSFIN